MGQARTISKGDLDAAMASAEQTVEGEFLFGGQEHFYLETQACLVRPNGEDGEMEVFCSAQDTNFLQVINHHEYRYMYIIRAHVMYFHWR